MAAAVQRKAIEGELQRFTLRVRPTRGGAALPRPARAGLSCTSCCCSFSSREHLPTRMYASILLHWPPSCAAILRCTNLLPNPWSFTGARIGGPPRSDFETPAHFPPGVHYIDHDKVAAAFVKGGRILGDQGLIVIANCGMQRGAGNKAQPIAPGTDHLRPASLAPPRPHFRKPTATASRPRIAHAIFYTGLYNRSLGTGLAVISHARPIPNYPSPNPSELPKPRSTVGTNRKNSQHKLDSAAPHSSQSRTLATPRRAAATLPPKSSARLLICAYLSHLGHGGPTCVRTFGTRKAQSSRR
jgi:hypothetical protein